MVEAGAAGGQEAAQGGPGHLLPRQLGGVNVLKLAERHHFFFFSFFCLFLKFVWCDGPVSCVSVTAREEIRGE